MDLLFLSPSSLSSEVLLLLETSAFIQKIIHNSKLRWENGKLCFLKPTVLLVPSTPGSVEFSNETSSVLLLLLLGEVVFSSVLLLLLEGVVLSSMLLSV